MNGNTNKTAKEVVRNMEQFGALHAYREANMDKYFSGKNANTNEGWRIVAESLREVLRDPFKDSVNCKYQWNSLLKKYKELTKYRSGEGVGDEATTDEAKDWPFFQAIQSYAALKDNFHPPFLLDATHGAFSMRREECTTTSALPTGISSLPLSLSPTPEIAASYCSILTSTPPNTVPSPMPITVPSPLPSPDLPSFSSQFLQYRPSVSNLSSTPSPTEATTSRHEKGRGSRLDRMERMMVKREKSFKKQMSSLMSVFGQMVQSDYPHIDASGLFVASSESESD